MRFRTCLIAALASMLPLAPAAAQMHKIYLNPNREFTSYFSAALQKKKVPVTVTLDPTHADYTARFEISTDNGSIFEGISRQLQYGMYNAGASARVTMSIIDVKSKDVVFSYTCQKPSRYNGDNPSVITSVAECLAKHWGSSLQK